ncbi:unnamed protein product [Sphagnum jensenii]|uniref:Uncharacterized protein n=1 Tax=Sphagnum jensenii TaxID=128206 RepID=A0ABP0XH17_9BRYO
MKLVAGSYERFLWGWEVKEKKKQLEWAFSYPAHLGAIKCIASCGSVVATGGADDTIKVFDLNAQKDMGSLYKHEGAVTCLQFHGPRGAGGAPVSNHPTHLLSGSEDGSIFIWDTDSWIHLKTMRSKKDSKGAVNDLSIHPTGMMALSVDRDRHLKMWNLMSGRCSFTLKLRSEASIVKFAPQDGGSYSMVRDAVVEVRDAESGTVLHPLEHEKRVLCLAQQLDHLLITGGEDSVVRAWDTRTGKQAWSIANAHTNRIRGLAIVGSNLGSDEHSSGLYDLISSASSDGMVRVWDSRMVDTPTPAPIMEAETKARLTCLVSCGVSRKSRLSSTKTLEEKLGVGEEKLSTADVKLGSKPKRKKKVKPSEDDGGHLKKVADGRPPKRAKLNVQGKARGFSQLLTKSQGMKRKASRIPESLNARDKDDLKRQKPTSKQSPGTEVRKSSGGGKGVNTEGQKRRKVRK